MEVNPFSMEACFTCIEANLHGSAFYFHGGEIPLENENSWAFVYDYSMGAHFTSRETSMEVNS